MTDTLNFIEEAIPSITRSGGDGRDPIKWEESLAPLKDKIDSSFRVWTYEKKTGATSRVAAVRDRLIKATPSDNWTIAVRPVPDDPEHFGVYVQYNGVFTDEEVAANAAKRQERSERIKAARASAAEVKDTLPEEAPAAPAPAPAATSPAERVAAAKKAAAK